MNDRHPIESSAASPSQRGLWALGFVAASLVALAAVPAYYGAQVADAQARMADVLEPAARHSSNLTILVTRQMARMEGFLLTGDRTTFREPYMAAIAEGEALLARLQLLSRDVDVEIFERVAQLVFESARWNFENHQIFDATPTDDDRARTQQGYEELLRGTRELNRAIESMGAQARREIAVARARQGRITFALALVALAATVIVGRIGYRYRELMAERERRRREAVRARREIDALLEATEDGVLGIDLDGKCTSLNPAGVKLLGYTEREIAGRDVHDTIFHSFPDGSPNPRGSSPILAALAAGEPLDAQDAAVLWRRKHVPFPARWSLRPLMDGVELRGAVLTFTDMTEIHEKEAALRRAIRQREDVISIVSHDLRNPLGVTLAAADILLDLPLDEGQRRRQAEIIARSGRRMQSLIDDLLDVARIEAGALVVRPSLEELEPIVREALEVFRHQAERKRVTLDIHLGGGTVKARVDRDRIMQAVSNLLDNALRLTPEGGRITLGVEDRGPDVAVFVADTGPGIPPELAGRLFDRFSQAEGSGKGRAGLGLAIVEGVTRAHGGRVIVDSEPGTGSTFTLLLPKAGPRVGEEGTVVG